MGRNSSYESSGEGDPGNQKLSLIETEKTSPYKIAKYNFFLFFHNENWTDIPNAVQLQLIYVHRRRPQSLFSQQTWTDIINIL